MHITDTIGLDDRAITEHFVRATGPGGQNVRKEATAVELRIDLERSALPSDVKERLMALAGRHVTSDGVLVVVSRAHRAQLRNREAARARLLDLLKRAAAVPAPRETTTPGPAARETRLVVKKRRSLVKRSRSHQNED